MIPYAGQDTWDSKPRSAAGERAYALFSEFGYDTVEVARRMNISEARAHNLITIERSRHHGLPNPYEGK